MHGVPMREGAYRSPFSSSPCTKTLVAAYALCTKDNRGLLRLSLHLVPIKKVGTERGTRVDESGFSLHAFTFYPSYSLNLAHLVPVCLLIKQEGHSLYAEKAAPCY